MKYGTDCGKMLHTQRGVVIVSVFNVVDVTLSLYSFCGSVPRRARCSVREGMVREVIYK